MDKLACWVVRFEASAAESIMNVYFCVNYGC